MTRLLELGDGNLLERWESSEVDSLPLAVRKKIQNLAAVNIIFLRSNSISNSGQGYDVNKMVLRLD